MKVNVQAVPKVLDTTVLPIDVLFNTIARFVEQTDVRGHFALAVSGGADSLALLILSSKLHKIHSNLIFTVLSVDHGLREESASEVSFVMKMAKKHGLQGQSLKWEGVKPTSNVQAVARQARYDLMTNWCCQNQVDGLIVAHHLEDQVETFFLRLSRGSGLDGLTAMQEVVVKHSVLILRPFLTVPRETLRSCIKEDIKPIVDVSNHDEKYARIRWRKLLPLLEEQGLTNTKILQTTERLYSAKQALSEVTSYVVSQIVTCHELGYYSVEREKFCALPEDIAFRVLQYILTIAPSYPPRGEQIYRLWKEIINGKNIRRNLNGFDLKLRKSTLLISREVAAIDEEYVLKEGQYIVWDKRFKIICLGTENKVFSVKKLDKDGVQTLRELQVVLSKNIPASVYESLPAVWCNKELIAVPKLKPYSGIKFLLIEEV